MTDWMKLRLSDYRKVYELCSALTYLEEEEEGGTLSRKSAARRALIRCLQADLESADDPARKEELRADLSHVEADVRSIEAVIAEGIRAKEEHLLEVAGWCSHEGAYRHEQLEPGSGELTRDRALAITRSVVRSVSRQVEREPVESVRPHTVSLKTPLRIYDLEKLDALSQACTNLEVGQGPTWELVSLQEFYRAETSRTQARLAEIEESIRELPAWDEWRERRESERAGLLVELGHLGTEIDCLDQQIAGVISAEEERLLQVAGWRTDANCVYRHDELAPLEGADGLPRARALAITRGIGLFVSTERLIDRSTPIHARLDEEAAA